MKQLKKLRIFLVVIATIFAFAASSTAQRETNKNVVVQFKKGANSATYKDSIRGDNVTYYKFKAEKDQKVSVSLEARNNALYFNLLDKETMLPIETDPMPREVREWEGVLPKTGEFIIRVYLIRAEARRNRVAPYTLNLKISDLQARSESIYGNYVTKSYAKRDEGYDWVAVSVSRLNNKKARVSVRSRADRKKPTCTFDGNASIADNNLLKVYGNNLTINFRFAGENLTIETDRAENRDKLNFFCSGGASLAGEYSKIDGSLDSKQIDKTAYNKSVMLNNYRFNVEVKGDTLSIQPIGLEIDNREVKHKINGFVTDIEIGDLNNDAYPELMVYITSKESNRYGSVIGYSVNNGKSIS